VDRDQEPASRCGLAFSWIDRPAAGPDAPPPARPDPPAPSIPQYRFASLVDMVKAHQQR
jgi:hypothetical protein